MSQRLNQIGTVLLIGFVGVALSLTYWMVWGRDALLAQSFNPRLVETERAIKRGTILDRQGEALIWSAAEGLSPSGMPNYRRISAVPAESFSALGYYSLTYGVGGLESVYDRELRGENALSPETRLLNTLLHHPQEGSSIRLTLYKTLQTQTYQAFKGRRGAAVVIEVPTGAVLALVSAPGFDAARLDLDFDRLEEDQNAPLLNRALQGVYQPGGMLQSALIAALLNTDPDGEFPVEQGDQPVKVNGLSLTCTVIPDQPPRTLLEAYVYGCPGAFTTLPSGILSPARLWQMVESFHLTTPPLIDRLEPLTRSAVTPWMNLTDPSQLQAELLGQGKLTLTPLQMALNTAIIANEGNAITPYMVSAIYPPTVNPQDYDGGETDPYRTSLPPAGEAVITREAADRVQAAMREGVLRGSAEGAQPSGSPEIQAHGAAGIAYTGKTAHAWFIGFATLPDGRKWVVSVVIEDSLNPASAAALARGIFEQAR
ncbi:MAG: hypothetical protein IT322_10205 [Anaerolineae bacterium]|nr:hypothetical protein [Anaerolineae bacterium]